MKISQKLLLIGILPLLAFLIVGILYARIHVDERDIIDESRRIIELYIPLSKVIHELQKERGLSNSYLVSKQRDKMDAQRKVVDTVGQSVLDAISRTSLTTEQGDSIRDFKPRLEALRKRVDGGMSSADLMGSYSKFISDVFKVQKALAEKSTYGNTASIFASLELLEIGKDNAGSLRGNLSAVLTANKPINLEQF